MIMAEYIEREALLKELKEKHDDMMQDEEYYGKKRLWHEALSHARVESIVECQPTADVVEVVRCKDCVNSRPLCHTEKKLYNDDCVGCTKISTSYHSVIMNENDYCSYGCAKMDGKGE